MTKTVRIALICFVVVVCFGVHAYGAKNDEARVVLATLYFKIGSAEIKPEFENELKEIQAALAADPHMGVRIEGYGLQKGVPEKNREVYPKRIQAVKQWFVKQGVAQSRLVTKSIAASKPAVAKSGTADPARSERVEIIKLSLKQPLAFLPTALYKFDAVVEGQQVVHDFIVQNKGSAPLEIKRVRTD
jgi:hypothetical protein